jgi:DNA replication protein DnaC
LDDLGTENISPTSKWFYEQFITRHDEYVKRKEAKFSIITTNLDQIAIAERYGSRALDRLLQNCAIFKFKSESFRRRDKKIYNADQMEIIT